MLPVYLLYHWALSSPFPAIQCWNLKPCIAVVIQNVDGMSIYTFLF